MENATSLRATLSKTDNTMERIQKSASAMMKYYDRNPTVAVTEWRNCLQSCRPTQLLPLLYVANEVLQTSKRNRGNKFLQAFSPVLSTSLQFICETVQDPATVEKVRRTAKIWGDRSVYSVRFIGELLNSLEVFRRQGGGSGGGGGMNRIQQQTPRSPEPSHANGKSKSLTNNNGSMPSKNSKSKGSSGTTADDDELSPFGDPDGPSLLQVDVKIDKDKVDNASSRSSLSSSIGHAPSHSNSNNRNQKPTSPRPADNKPGTKRKRTISSPSSPPSSSSISPPTQSSKQPDKKYTTTTLHELISRTEELNTQFQSTMSTIHAIPPSYYSNDPELLSDVVGNDLGNLYEGVRSAERSLGRERRRLYDMARERRALEEEAVRHVPRLKESLRQDEEELKVCDAFEDRLRLLVTFIEMAKTARAEKIEEETKRQKLLEAEAREKEIEAERRRSLEMTMKSNAPQPGMVWNKVAREYQYMNDDTEEDWRN